MLSNKTIEMCKEKLPAHLISKRTQRGITLDYVEGHSMITRMNEVFGYGNWKMTIIELKQISEEKNSNGNNVIGYMSRVRIEIQNDKNELICSREDVGFGSGIAKMIYDAHEGAGKEAVTDAFKRAVRTFGNSFGLALYDKEKKGVDYTSEKEKIDDLNQKFGKPETIKINYKIEINKIFQQEEITKKESVLKMVEILKENGLDVSNNAEEIYIKQKEKLIEIIKENKNLLE